LGQFLDWICIIQQIPAPTFREKDRAAYIQAEFLRLGLSDVQLDSCGNVLARWPGGDARPLVISAHLDTVHRAEDPLPLIRTDSRLTGPGIADNSTSLAALLVVASLFKANQSVFPGDIWLVADVCEEGLGNLAGMRALVDRFLGTPCAYLILEGLGLGQVCHRGLGVERYQVKAQTAGGHSWVDYGSPSAIHEIAQVVADLADITIPQKPRASLNVGIIQGGTSVNTIASQASFELDLRAEDQPSLSRLSERVRRLITRRDSPGVDFSIAPIGQRPAGELPADHPLVRLAANVLQELKIPVTLEIGSTDANIPLSQGFPAICLGLSRGGHPHTAREYLEIEPLQAGLQQILNFIDRVWQL
jgi:acetylornithine deacetylase/succinyl-diaminopimelate desuccinylase-like protein